MQMNAFENLQFNKLTEKKEQEHWKKDKDEATELSQETYTFIWISEKKWRVREFTPNAQVAVKQCDSFEKK